jgi:hypothetical protein
MAERMKDSEDIQLEALFASEPVANDGFSESIQQRIRRRMWIRRLTLPIAILVGGAIAAKPLAGLVAASLKLASLIPANVSGGLESVSASSLPQFTTVLLGGVLAFVFVMATRVLDEI